MNSTHIKRGLAAWAMIAAMAAAPLQAWAGPRMPAQNAPDDGFSMAFVSDTQLTWWRGGVAPDCDTAACIDEKGMESNQHMVSSLNSLKSSTQPLAWPANGEISQRAGEPILAPSGVIINGDLTSFGHKSEVDQFNQIYYSGLLQYPIWPGLGNHDYENNVHGPIDVNDILKKVTNGDDVPGCTYDNWYFPDYNRCAKNAVWWMANQITRRLPNVTSRDVSGYLAVHNMGGFEARMSVSYNLDGTDYNKEIRPILLGQWKYIIIPPAATGVHIRVEENTGLIKDGKQDWRVLKNFSDPLVEPLCYELSGTTLDPNTKPVDCPAEWPDGSSGSLAYSFDAGQYHFIQLNYFPGYEMDLPSTHIVKEVVANILDPKMSPGFKVTRSYSWLAKDVAAATAAGKFIVINLHNANGSIGNLIPFAAGNNLGLFTSSKGDPYYDIHKDAMFADAIRNQNVVAIFAGHIHQDFGQTSEINNGRYTIPIFLSGSVECESFLVAEFHPRYFNVAVMRSQTGDAVLVDEKNAVCDTRDKNNKNVEWGYNKNSGNTSARTVFINRAPVLTTALDTAQVQEGAIANFHASATDPENDAVSFTWDFGDGESSTDAAPAHRFENSGSHDVIVTASDAFGGVMSQTLSVNVENVAPALLINNPVITIDENSYATFNGTINDPGIHDSFSLQVDWGDGQSGVIDLPAGATRFTASHLFKDDDPAGTPADRLPVRITVADQDGGSNTYDAAVIVQNVAPAVKINALVDDAGQQLDDGSIVMAGQPVTLSLSTSDTSPADTLTVDVDWGDGNASHALSAGAASTQHIFTTPGVYTVTAAVSDDDTGRSTTTRVINAVAPAGAAQRATAQLLMAKSGNPQAALQLRATLATLGDPKHAQSVIGRINNKDAAGALTLISQSLSRLEQAEKLDKTLNLSQPKRALVLAAQAIANDVIVSSESKAITPWTRWRASVARYWLAEGRLLMNASRYSAAAGKFSYALRWV